MISGTPCRRWCNQSRAPPRAPAAPRQLLIDPSEPTCAPWLVDPSRPRLRPALPLPVRFWSKTSKVSEKAAKEAVKSSKAAQETLSQCLSQVQDTVGSSVQRAFAQLPVEGLRGSRDRHPAASSSSSAVSAAPQVYPACSTLLFSLIRSILDVTSVESLDTLLPFSSDLASSHHSSKACKPPAGQPQDRCGCCRKCPMMVHGILKPT